jgi:hypothetical protein
MMQKVGILILIPEYYQEVEDELSEKSAHFLTMPKNLLTIYQNVGKIATK